MKVFLKKGLILTVSLVFFLTAAFLLAACEDKPLVAEKIIISVIDGDVTVKTYDVNDQSKTAYLGKTGKKNLDELIVELADRNVFEIERQDGTYGAFYNKIGAIQSSGTNYLYLFTDLSAYQDTTDFRVEMTYGEITYVSASVGAAELPVTASCHYLITLV